MALRETCASIIEMCVIGDNIYYCQTLHFCICEVYIVFIKGRMPLYNYGRVKFL